MTFSFDMQMEGLMHTLAECEQRGLDLSPPLKQFGREKRREIIARIDSGRGMPPLAPSTLAKYEQRDNQDRKFTLSGGIRASYKKTLEREAQRMKGLKEWAKNMYGDNVPEKLRTKFSRYEERMRRIQEASEKRRENMLFDASQVSARQRFAGQNLVEVRVMKEGKRKLARIHSAGFPPSASVRLPTHLNKPGAVYQIPASSLRQVSANKYAVGSGSVLRTQKPEKPSSAGKAPKSHKLLGRVPGSIYYRVAKSGRRFALIYGSWWSKDGVHNEGDGHVPKREHISLESEDLSRLSQILVDYGIEPLKRGG